MTIYPGGPQDGVKYVATAPDGSRAAFNDPADADYIGMAYFTGLDSPDIREALDQRTGADGGVQGLNFRGSRPVVGTVEIVAASTTDRNTKFQKLKRAMNSLRTDGTLTFTPDGGLPSQIKYRLNGPVRRSDERGWKYTVQFPLMAADPFIYSQTLHTTTVNASPWQATITNQGDGYASPTIDVVMNTAANLALTNSTTGQTLNAYGTVLGSGVDPARYFGSFALAFVPGTSGTGNGQFTGTPGGIAVDASGNVFVTDPYNNRVQKFNSSGVYQSQFGTAGAGNGQFNNPIGIAIDAGGKIWVADANNNRIQRFSAAGAYETQFGTFGAGNGQFNSPQDLAFDSAGNIYVCDYNNFRIQKLTAGTPPVYASQVATQRPSSIVANAAGTSFWFAAGDNKIYTLTNGSPPVVGSSFGGTGSTDGKFTNLFGVTRDSANNVYATSLSDGVQKFNSSGTFLARAAGLTNAYGIGMLGSTTSPLYVAASGGPDGVATQTVFKYNVGPPVTFSFDLNVGTIRASGVNAYKELYPPASDWWKLQPGDNLIQVTGGSSWTISWRDAWL